MDIPSQNAPEPLCAEILAEARRQSEQVIRLAHDKAAALLVEAENKAARLKEEQLAAARTEAARGKELILATIPVEVGRERSLAIELLLQVIYERAREQLRARRGFDYRSTIVALASEAIGHMTGE